MLSQSSSSPAMTRTATLAALGTASAAALSVAPGLFGLAGRRPLVWAVPFRVPIGVGLAGLSLAAGLAGCRWRQVLPSAAVLGLAAVASLATTVTRGLSQGALPPAQPGDVTVLAANVFKAQADPAALTRLIVAEGVDAVSLPEASLELADDVAARVVAATGLKMQVFYLPDGGGYGFGTALLVSERLGEYRPTMELMGGDSAVVTAAPVCGVGPVLAAAHTAAPVRGYMQHWRREVQAVADWCASTPAAIAAGDLNATLDHPGLQLKGSCIDAGEQTGTGSYGTWPAKYPALLGASIDHALADGRVWWAVESRIEVVPGSDHRALLSRWRRRTLGAPGSAA